MTVRNSTSTGLKESKEGLGKRWDGMNGELETRREKGRKGEMEEGQCGEKRNNHENEGFQTNPAGLGLGLRLRLRRCPNKW